MLDVKDFTHVVNTQSATTPQKRFSRYFLTAREARFLKKMKTKYAVHSVLCAEDAPRIRKYDVGMAEIMLVYVQRGVGEFRELEPADMPELERLVQEANSG